MTVTCCPNCGHDLEALEPFTVGSLGVDRGGAVIWWSGHQVPLTVAERLIVIALARAGGNLVAKHVLADCEGYEGDNPDNNIAVLLSRIRNKFLVIDQGFDRIETIRGAGIRWLA